MPRVALVAFTGFRVREREMLELGLSLPSLAPRGKAIGRLPALGLLTLAGMTPNPWEVSYHEAGGSDGEEELAERLIEEAPDLVAISALTASIDEAYSFADRVRRAGLKVAIGGLHATACPDEAAIHADAVVVGDGESSWPRLLGDVASGSLAPRYRASTPFDLADSPLPRFDLLADARRPRYTVQTQRGCPLACDFCAASRLLGPFREKPAEQIAEELRAIGARSRRPVVELADDNYVRGEAPRT